MKYLKDTGQFDRRELPLNSISGESRSYHIPNRKGVQIYPLSSGKGKLKLLETFTIYMVHMLNGAHYRRINVNFLSVEYINKGSLAVRQNGRTYLAEAGDIFLMHPEGQNEFMTGPEGFCLKTSLNIRGSLLPAILEQSGLKKIDILTQIDQCRFEQLIEQLKKISGKETESAFRENRVLSYEILDFLQFPEKENQVPEELSEVTSYMESHLEHPLTLEEMANRCGYSKAYLIRRFRNFFGITPYQKLLQLRMEKAARLLLSAEHLSIKEITLQTGYPNALNFSTEFRKRFGISPLKYRRQTNPEKIILQNEDKF